MCESRIDSVCVLRTAFEGNETDRKTYRWDQTDKNAELGGGGMTRVEFSSKTTFGTKNGRLDKGHEMRGWLQSDQQQPKYKLGK